MEKWNFKAMKFFLIAFFVYIFLEGVLRKWVLPSGAGMIMYALKYGLLACSYICYLMLPTSAKRGKVFGMQIAFTLYIFLIIASSITFLGSSNGPLISFIAIAQYCLPIMLVFAIPTLLTSRVQLQTTILWVCILATCIYILGTIQYSMPPFAPINRYSGETATNEIATAAGAVRITTVFNYITPTGDFCGWIALFAMMALTTKLQIRESIYTAVILIFSIICAFMVGSRSVMVFLILDLFIVIGYDAFFNHRIRFIVLASILFLCIIIYYFTIGIPAVDTFLERSEMASYDVDSRITKTFDFESYMDFAGWFGKGAGITSNALQKLLTRPIGIYFEEEMGRLMMEFGILGFIIVIGIRIYILIQMLHVSQMVHNKFLRSFSFACTFAIIPSTFCMQMSLYNWFSYFCYFTFIGLNYAIYNIDRNECQQLHQAS